MSLRVKEAARGMGFLDSYVVRIYRKAENDPRLIVVTAQKIGQEDKMAFSTVDELWSILNPGRKESL